MKELRTEYRSKPDIPCSLFVIQLAYELLSKRRILNKEQGIKNYFILKQALFGKTSPVLPVLVEDAVFIREFPAANICFNRIE